MTHLTSVPPIREEFLGVRLGDARLDRRLVRIAEAVYANPSRSLPYAMGSEGELEGAYRFFGNERVSWSEILKPHIDRTWKRAGDQARILCIEDTTEFGFKGETPKKGLSRLGKIKQGFFGHIALAVSADGERRPLGVLGMLPFVRKNTVEVPDDGDDDDYAFAVESDRWVKLVELVEDKRPEGVQVVHVMDREGDQYPLFARLVELNTDFVIRLTHDRRLAGNEPQYVSDVLQEAPIVLTRTVKLSRRRGGRPPHSERKHPPRDERSAVLEVRAARVVLRKPWSRQSGLPRELALNVVHVTEPDPPENAEPMTWTLITTLPIDAPEQVAEVVDVYRARWLIEEFFKAVKTGCAYRKRQLESLGALLAALAVTIPIAWRLLALRWAARHQPDVPASTIFSKLELAVLRRADPKKRGLPGNPTVRAALLSVARLGGHKRSNGEPGWQILGRGLQRLLDQVEGAKAMLALMRSDPGFEQEDGTM